MKLTPDYFNDWLERYFTAYQTNDLTTLDGLFSEEVVYYFGPFEEPAVGKLKVLMGWLSGPPPEEFSYSYSPIAIREDTGVAHWNVVHRSNSKPDMRAEVDGILVIRFDEQGQCIEHKEWFVIREIP